MFKDVANLVYITETTDADGYPIESLAKTEVFVNKKSVKRTEFYTAMNSGLRPSIVFELRVDDYELTKHIVNGKAVYAEKVEFDGATYEIIRTYSTNESMIELTCG